MLSTVIPEPAAWHGPTLAADRYLIPIPAAVLGELEGALAELRRAPVPTLLLVPEHFPLAATARWMREVRRRLDEGPGFVMLDRLPVDAMSRDEAIALYWLLMSFLEPPGGAGMEGHRHLRRAPRRAGVHAGHAGGPDSARGSRCTPTAAWARRRPTT